MADKNLLPTSIFAKSLLFLTKIRDQILQLDDDQFPTETSSHVKTLLKNILDDLKEVPNKWAPSPKVFYKQIFGIQELVDHLARSSNEYISWPVVNYFNGIWNKLFDKKDFQVFFSHGTQHNYGIYCFSAKLYRQLSQIMPSFEIENRISSSIYCLQLASLEEENLPIYANVAHEYGHVVYQQYYLEIQNSWADLRENCFKVIGEEIELCSSREPQTIKRRIEKSIAVLMGFIKELTADIAGALLLGPNFFLSLNEMAWGSERMSWPVLLSPALQFIKGYPSFDFRLKCVNRITKYDLFCDELKKNLDKLGLSSICEIPNISKFEHLELEKENVVVLPEIDTDSLAIKTVLNKKMEFIKEVLCGYEEKVKALLEEKMSTVIYETNSHDIAQLILRLSHKITPNIIPAKSVLGTPAEFPYILLAASIYRLSLLMNADLGEQDEVINKLNRVERLTIKAFESSYIQKEFDDWTRLEGDRDGDFT